MSPTRQQTPAFSLRLELSYDYLNVRIQSAQRVKMMAPTGESTLLTGHSGSWIELRDAEEKVLYQRVIWLPMAPVVEVAEPPSTRQMTWRASPLVEGTLDVIVPDAPETTAILIFANPRDTPAAQAVVIARVNRGDLIGWKT